MYVIARGCPKMTSPACGSIPSLLSIPFHFAWDKCIGYCLRFYIEANGCAHYWSIIVQPSVGSPDKLPASRFIVSSGCCLFMSKSSYLIAPAGTGCRSSYRGPTCGTRVKLEPAALNCVRANVELENFLKSQKRRLQHRILYPFNSREISV